MDESQQYHAIPRGARSPPPAASLHSILLRGGKVNPFDLELSESSDEDDSPLTAVKGDVESARTRDELRISQNEGPSSRDGLNSNHSSDESAWSKHTPTRQGAEMFSNLFPSTIGQEQSPKESPLRAAFPNQQTPDAGKPSGHRTPMDVDAFKRLLLTGAKDPAPAVSTQPPILGRRGSQGDNSSNTDTSSLSKNSILDSQTDLRLETPASSHDITPLNEDGHFSFPTTGSRYGRTEPPTPPRRRGSDIGRNHYTGGSSEQSTFTQSKTGSPRPLSVVTDLNKSLPAHPPIEVTTSIQPESPLSSNFTAAARARVAPPPPLSRRNSQMRAKQQHFHGVSTSIAEEILPPPKSIHPPPPAITKAPAPPPPRRKGTDRAAALPSDHEALTAEAPLESLTKMDHALPKAPPPPPSRSGSRAIASKPSQASSLSRSTTVPPPPPPRHRASSGSSYASKRASAEMSGPSNGSRRSSSQLVPEEAQPKTPEEQPDFLADLSALQKELDAYRTTFGS